ncbi:MAG: sensor histidine kinase, partial [Bryobacteraceae bacterium]
FVTHEIRTPLTAIQGSSELMTRYNLSEEKRRQIAELIHSESRRLAHMIETFLSVERLSAGQMQLRREPFLADEVVAACVARVRPLAERKNIRVRAEPIEDGALEGDRELMEYAIYNLLTNAVKYSPPDTEVTVSGGRHGGRVRIAVKDQGYGMDRDELRHIFQKFYRTRRAEASGEKGTGIGLSIVREIVTQHGGSIEVESEPGKGSCFTVVLPARAASPAGVN